MSLFQKLSPQISEVKDIYKEAFDFVFTDPDIKNIAVSGAFGAGKTSVFESYMQHYKRGDKVIRISLAHFGQMNTKRTEGGFDEAQLEAKIINQIIHQIKPKAISKTGFTARIEGITWKSIIKLIGLLLVCLIPLYIFFGSKAEQMINNITWGFFRVPLLFLRTSDGILLLCIIFAIILFLFMLSLIKQSKGINLFKSLKIKDVSLEFPDNETESYFNKYLTELRYVFENSGSTIVAIDDIDRYLSSAIFEKIRELNTIINFDEDKEKIRFFYIIKDDIFKSKDRTKFFDFIIPIIPVVDSSNSYGQLKTSLVDQFVDINFDKRFIRGLSIFIDDMRLLKNIINEFIIYQKLLNEEELNPNKLLAIIAYKNIFPKDFNDLQAGTGYLFGLLKSRNEFAENYLQVAREKIDELNDQIAKIKNETLESVDELGTLFLKPIPNMERVSGAIIDQYKTQRNLFKKIKENPTDVGIRNNLNPPNKDYSNYFDDLEKIPEYQTRKQVIELKAKGELLKLEEEKKVVERKIQSVCDSHLLSNLIDDTNKNTSIDTFLKIPLGKDGKQYTEITSDIHNKIIPFLIKSGMIDENYKDYLTYFYDNDLKLTDQKFVRAIFAESPLSQEHLLTNPQEILERSGGVSENNFAYINKDLFFYVINNRMEKDGNNFIRLFKRKMSGDLIKKYLHDGEEMTFIVSLLNTNWDSFYSDIVVGDRWSQIEKEYYLRLLLIYSSTQALGVVEDINSISYEININGRILEGITGQESNSVIPNLLGIDVKFENIPVLYSCEEIIEGIYENNLYDLTIPNIQFWLQRKYDNFLNTDVGSLLSNVFSKPTEKLSIYVLDSLDDVLYNLFEEDPDLVITDNQEAVWRVLESEDVNLEYKENYIKRLSSPVKDIREKDDNEVLVALLQNDKVTFNLNNLLTLFTIFNEEFTPEFISYLEKHKNEWASDRQRDSSLFTNQVLDKFFTSVLAEPALDGKVTEKLLYATAKRVTQPLIITSPEKAKAIINSGALLMDNANLVFIRANFPDLLPMFQKKEFNDFRRLLESKVSIAPEEIVGFIESGLLNGSQQLSLLRAYQGKVPYKETYRFPGVKKYIIERRFDVNDLQKVVSDPTSLIGDNLRVVKNLIIRRIDYVVKNKIQLPYKLLSPLYSEQRINRDQAIEVFSNSINGYQPEQIVKIIYDLAIEPFREMFDGKHPVYIDNPVNQRILKSLESKRMASKRKRDRLYRKRNWR